jgi:UPF0755 protein
MFKKIIGFGLILVAIMAAVGFGVAIWLNTSPAVHDEQLSLVIHQGQSLESIATTLQERGIVRSALFLRIYARLLGTEQSFRQGRYSFRSILSTREIHDLIVSGKQVNLKVTIPEGFTSRQIAVLLGQEKICDPDDFLAAVKDAGFLGEMGLPGATADGYLFPDTYLFPEKYPAESVVRYMVENFRDKLQAAVPDWAKRSAKEQRAALVIASIVEREYISPEEAPKMASVFYNRLEMNKPLESCATIVYVMTEEQNLPHPSRLFYRDLARKSAYNTYLHSGLPPGPISNPGLTALKAAFNPEKTDFLYFVLKGPNSGQHIFTRTFAEHSQATVLYLKGQG